MSFFNKLFGVKEHFESQDILVDMHSHILFGLDDGAKTIDDSIALLQKSIQFGYKKMICTPHIMGDFYRNSYDTIKPRLDAVNEEIVKKGLDIKVDFAAEYYLDEFFIEKLDANEKLLTFGDNYLLVETSYMNKPHNFDEAVFKILTKGYKLVLAHPERYVYLFNDFKFLRDVHSKGVYFQLNLLSLAGYYSGTSQKIAELLIDENMVSFIGTDCHAMKHMDLMAKVKTLKYYHKVTSQPLLNNTLI